MGTGSCPSSLLTRAHPCENGGLRSFCRTPRVRCEDETPLVLPLKLCVGTRKGTQSTTSVKFLTCCCRYCYYLFSYTVNGVCVLWCCCCDERMGHVRSRAPRHSQALHGSAWAFIHTDASHPRTCNSHACLQSPVTISYLHIDTGATKLLDSRSERKQSASI